MRITWRAAGLVLSAFCATAVSAQADDFRVFYAEQVALKTSDATEFAANLPSHLSFIAYGRQFELDLEPNSRLLSKLPADIRASLSQYQPLRGRLTGLPGSWVRLTRNGSEWHGAIWDGLDLYMIAPARTIAPALVNPLAAPTSALVVFRFSDAVSGLGSRFCGTSYTPHTDDESSALSDYNALVAELRENAALLAVPQRQIEVATIGDFEFFTKYQSENPQGVLITTMNMVDGIFSEQVGVAILLPVVSVFNSANDPFTTSIAQNLLDELGAYREATPEVRSRGLAHLITGRNLTGDTAGIAYLDALCEPFRGVSLTDDSFGNANTFLIAAHELGHNFGAPHDAESGSPCAAVPPNFIMAPEVNGSDTFSQCSLEQMAPRIAAAACITRSSIGDATIAIDPPTVRGLTGDTIPVGVDVSSVGTAPARDVVVTLSFQESIVSATVPGGTCSIGGGQWTCQLGTITDGTSRRIDIGVRSLDAVTATLRATLTASNDRDPANNSAQASVIIDPAADVTVSVSPEEVVGFTRQPLAFSTTVRSLGPRAATDVVVTIRATPLELLSATSDGGTCTRDFTSFTCTFATLPAGASHRLDVEYVGTRTDVENGLAGVNASNDGNRSNNFDGAVIRISALRDATIQLATTQLVAAVGQPFTISGNIQSIGPETVHGVTAFLLQPPGVTIDAISVQGGTCTLQPSLSCIVGDMPTGTSRRIDIQAHATAAVSTNGAIVIDGSDDDGPQNDRADMNVDVRHLRDVALNPFERIIGSETLVARLGTPLTSRGLNSTTDIAVAVSLPASYTIRSVTLDNGNCSISTNLATCTLPTLASGASAMLRLEVSSTQPGSFAGTITVTSPTDADPANNVQNLTLENLPLFDVGVMLPPQRISASTGQLVNLPITVFTGPQPVTDARIFVDFSPGLYTLESMTTSVGVCITTPRLECTLGSLNSHASAQIVIGVRPNFSGSDTILVDARIANDGNGFNNTGRFEIDVGNSGDVVVGLNVAAVTAIVDQSFNYPTITVSASSRVDDVSLDLTLPDSLRVESVSQTSGAFCSITLTGFTCHVPALEPGIPWTVAAQVRGMQIGTFQSTVAVQSIRDTNAQNNARNVSLNITGASPPAPPDNQAGGGGGALGWLTLLGLMAATAHRRSHSLLPEPGYKRG